ncbi:ubiquitin domain-containing protein DSK2b-like isoform X2 [Helianthus annuus]|uniref:ubiquitin domain-containing protein DSK2b-like isoform X2 n=1 Tax=Helianthus annuus TaxID=4232 RepID=UPI001652C1D2|nr:ubiquitin domain-containing protein DSK2b-like isoform X2 [Helianthus annuus]
MVFTVKNSLQTSHTNLKRLQSFGLAVPPEQLYATQLSQLQEMGFFDTQENIRALRATAGNVHAAVERLLGNFGP